MQQDTMQEQWTRWEPVGAVSGDYKVVSCCENYENGLVIILSDVENPKQQKHIIWQYSAVAYRKTQIIKKTFLANLNKLCDTNYSSDQIFFKVTNSIYQQEISDESGKLLDYTADYLHFALLTSDELLDIIVDYDPEIKTIHVP